MGFLTNALGDAIGKGIKKGLDSAVGSAVKGAVEATVKPAAEKAANAVANSAAQHLNETAKSANETMKAAGEANEAASKVTPEQWNTAFDFLGNMANSAANGMKICPQCGEGVKGDLDFCPHCGAKLPTKTLGQMCVCEQCGYQNTVGTSFCVKCGAKLPCKVEEEEQAKAKDEAVLAQWKEKLPAFPVWDQGGEDFELYDGDESVKAVYFRAGNTSQAALDRYCQTLKANGFVRPEGYSFDETLYKVVDGTPYCFNQSEAFSSGEGVMNIVFYIDMNIIKKKEEPKKSSGLGGLFGSIIDKL